MHVGVDASSWENERGFGRFTRSLVSALAARDSGFRYTLLFDQPPSRPVPGGVEVHVVGTTATMSEASSGKAARRVRDMLGQALAARRLGCDVFFFPASYSYFPVPSRVPLVICIHDTIPERFPDLIFPGKLNFELWKAKTWAATAQATRILTVSEASAQDITSLLRVPRAKIDLTTEGADPVFQQIRDPARQAAVRKRHRVPLGVPLLIYVGGFNRHKNVIRLIDAMPAIVEACPDAHLAIVGRISGARFWDNVGELRDGASRDPHVVGRILFTGEIDDAELAELMNASTALVLPSLWEGFGLPALEAMACGLPVLVSRRGSLPEVVGDAGLYFDPENAAEIAARAIDILRQPGLAKDLSARALARAAAFDWDTGARLAEASFLRAARVGGSRRDSPASAAI